LAQALSFIISPVLSVSSSSAPELGLNFGLGPSASRLLEELSQSQLIMMQCLSYLEKQPVKDSEVRRLFNFHEALCQKVQLEGAQALVGMDWKSLEKFKVLWNMINESLGSSSLAGLL